MKKLIFICLISVAILPLLSAGIGIRDNKKVIKGTVKNNTGYPVRGARIIINGMATSTYTDERGCYKIRIKSNTATIGVISFGGGILIDSVRNREEINFVLSPLIAVRPPDDINALRPPINMGYSVERSSTTSWATRCLYPQKSKRHYSNVKEMVNELIGPTGSPLNFVGGDGPLVLVNGLQVYSLSDIQPDLVESVSYLKDASAAIYGSRAFGGVVLIKTKTSLIDH